MIRDESQSPTSLEIARRLLAREVGPPGKGKPEVVGSALQRTVVRVSTALCDSLGDDGCNALLTRALARTEPKHAALKHMHRSNNGRVHLDGVVTSVAAHGAAEVTEAIEALLAELVDILGRLIGEDMAVRLIDQNGDASRPRTTGGGQTP